VVPAVVLDRQPDLGVGQVEQERADRELQLRRRQSVAVDRHPDPRLHRRPGPGVGHRDRAAQPDQPAITRVPTRQIQQGDRS